MKTVVVTWVDAISDDSWTDIEKAKELQPPVMKTLGYLIHEDDTKVIIAASYDEENEKVASFYAIPRAWLIEIKVLAIDGNEAV